MVKQFVSVFTSARVFFAVLFGFGLFFTSCEKDNFEPAGVEAYDNEAIETRGETAGLASVIDFDYFTAPGYYVISGYDADGNLAIYYGQQNDWTLLEDKYGKNAIWGTYYGAAFSTGTNFIYAFNFNGKVAVNGGYNFYDKPRHNSGKKVFGDMVEFIDLDYFADAGIYVLSGKDANGGLVIYYGDGSKDSWTKLEDKYGKNAVWGSYYGAAFSNAKKFIFAFQFKGKVAVNGGYKFYGKPRHNSGKKVFKEMVEFVDLDYFPAANIYVLVGKDAMGGLVIYYGDGGKKNWTKLEDKYGKNSVWGAYLGAAYSDTDSFLFALDFQRKGEVATNGGYKFYGKPRHNSGKKFVR